MGLSMTAAFEMTLETLSFKTVYIISSEVGLGGNPSLFNSTGYEHQAKCATVR